ncbi:hypothetical protein FD02_GL001522 [Lacticaseibacillus nasuensis JCM 17158]|uniref:Uncharacterized protein n=3 Tax=Lacticaseibacillus TaxID=2759736 RepID=A0A0R1JM86_9LACO|nr:hypothetical protein FD02_GL001522 [Lacticaseibacillus nasuensis JCM 17158]
MEASVMSETEFRTTIDAQLLAQGDRILAQRGMTRAQLLTKVYKQLAVDDTAQALDAVVTAAVQELTTHPAPPITDADWWAHLDPEAED